MTNKERALKDLKQMRYGGRYIGTDIHVPLEVLEDFDMAIEALEEEPSKENKKCIWIKYDYRTICPRECGGESPYWRIPENMENLKYCPYCGKEIEVRE